LAEWILCKNSWSICKWRGS